MIILGIDPSQKTGFAYLYDDRDNAAIRAGVIKAEGDAYEDKAACLARAFGILLRAERPDLIAFEMPIRTQPGGRQKKKFMGEEQEIEGGSGLNAVISSNQMVGALAGIAGFKNIPFVTIATVTWRKAFLGYGTHPGWERKDWKKAVRDACARERIHVTNDDMADAVGVAIAAKNTDAYRMLRYERERRAA